MRIAVCFSGQMRTALYANKSIFRFLNNHLHNIDFFLHTWDVKSEKKLFGDEQPEVKYTAESYECLNKFLEVVKTYKPKKYEVEILDEYKKSLTKEQEFLPLWYSWYKTLLLVKEYEYEHNFNYDVVIKLRFDVIYNTSITLDNLFDDYLNKIQKGTFFADTIWYDKNESEPYLIHDVFFMSNSEIVHKLINFYEFHILKIKKSNDENPHRLFGTFLNNNNISIEECLPESKKLWTPLREMLLNIFDPNDHFYQLYECNRILYNHNYQYVSDLEYVSLDSLIKLKKYTLEHMNYAPNALGKIKPLKIAFCVSGQLRTWDKCYQNICKLVTKLEEKDANVDFFCHSWDFESESTPVLLYTGNDDVVKHDDITINDVLAIYKPKDYLFENYEKNKSVVEYIKNEGIKYKNQTPITWSSQQFYSLMRAAEMKRNYEINNNIQYDVCIRLRYDQYIPEKEIDNIISKIFSIQQNTIHTMHNRKHNTYPFIIYGDVFWISDSLTYDKVATFYRALPTIDNKLFEEGMGTPPENVLTHYIKHLNIINSEMVLDLRICKTKEFIRKKTDLGLNGLGNNEIFYEDIVNDDEIKYKII
jgi:hypothetical protein